MVYASGSPWKPVVLATFTGERLTTCNQILIFPEETVSGVSK